MGFLLSDVRKSYVAPDGSTLTVLDVPLFQIQAGEQVALLGSSGSGKTTLLHVIAGIVAPDNGSVLIESMPGKSDVGVKANIAILSEADRDRFRGQHIGYIFQTHHLLPGFTALENVLLGMSFTGRSADRAWAEQLLTEVGLKDRLHYRPSKLSVGQQQRVAVARALANRPSLVLADEPTGALDFANAQQVLDLIRKLCDEVKASLLIVTHDRSIAAQLSRTVDLYDINRAAIRPAQFAGASR
jgi:putative ABC transport system ATP-binding protein